jgi:hypothetical protein
MRVREPKRRDLLLAALGSPMLLALQGCASPLPVSLTATTSAGAQSLLNESAAAHGLAAFRKINDLSVSYDGEWRALIGKLEPALVDPAFRGKSEERLLLREGVIAQAHRGSAGRKQVLRRAVAGSSGEVRVWFDGQEARDSERRRAAALVADSYALFLLGPMLLVDRTLVMELAEVEWVDEHACDVLRVQLAPGLGLSRLDRIALFIDRKERLLRRVRFPLDELQSAPDAIAEVEMHDHVTLHGVRWPTRFYQRLVRPIRLPLHDWQVTGLDVNRGYSAADLSGVEFAGAARAPAAPLGKRVAG